MKQLIRFKNLFVTAILLTFILSIPVSLTAAPTTAGAKAATKTSSQLININTADIAQLSSLPGIGPSIAERIVKYRKESGAFKTPQDLGKVKGIGEKKLAKVLNKITVK
jgi:competence protein ComEA